MVEILGVREEAWKQHRGGCRSSLSCARGHLHRTAEVSKIRVARIEQHTQAIRTFFGRAVFGSFTLTNANWMRPSENSSIKSTSSPSAQCQPYMLSKELLEAWEGAERRACSGVHRLFCPGRGYNAPCPGLCDVPKALSSSPAPVGSCSWSLRTSRALYFQDAFLAAILLERADERGSHSKQSPLAIRG
jgi:hypothetical protein